MAIAEKKLEEKRIKKIAEEKERKKKEAAEKARKKKLAEQKRKRKIEQDKIAQKIRVYKRKADNFYKDIEEFVKSGGNIDLVKLLCRQMDEKLGKDFGTSETLITYVKDRLGHDQRYAIDASKIKCELDWAPKYWFNLHKQDSHPVCY